MKEKLTAVSALILSSVLCLTMFMYSGASEIKYSESENSGYNIGINLNLSAEEPQDDTDLLSFYNEMFDGQFFVSGFMKISDTRTVLAAFDDIGIMLIDLDSTDENVAIAFESEFASDSEGEIKQIKKIDGGYAVTTNNRAFLLDGGFNLVNEYLIANDSDDTVPVWGNYSEENIKSL